MPQNNYVSKYLEGKRVLVTGGSKGIGRAISEVFAEQGAKVLINYSREADGSDDAMIGTLNSIERKKGIVKYYNLDISDVSRHDEMLMYISRWFGGIDVLVNNAGTLTFTPYKEITEALWDRTHDVNVKGAFFLTQKAAEYMKNNQPDKYGLRGSVIMMSSISAKKGGMLQHHYCPTKAALESLVKCFSESLGPYGIRTNGIAPGTIITDINRRQLEQDSEGTELQRRTIPLQRLGEPEDVATVALFLADNDLSRYVNGAIIDVNGGWHNVLAGQSK